MEAHKCEELYKVALLHDIGKFGIADDVLRKPSKLMQKEYEDIKLHTVIGAGILSNMEPKAAMAKAIATARSYSEGLPFRQAAEELIRCKDTLFDAALGDAFI